MRGRVEEISASLRSMKKYLKLLFSKKSDFFCKYGLTIFLIKGDIFYRKKKVEYLERIRALLLKDFFKRILLFCEASARQSNFFKRCSYLSTLSFLLSLTKSHSFLHFSPLFVTFTMLLGSGGSIENV